MWSHFIRFQRTLFQRLDLRLLFFVAVVACGAWSFIELADEVSEGSTEAIDLMIVQAMRTPGDLSDPLGPTWFEEGVRDITGLGSVTVLLFVVLIASGLLIMHREWKRCGLLLLMASGTVILNLVLKDYFNRPRPDIVEHVTRVSTASFPSGHSLGAAAVYLTIGVLLIHIHRQTSVRIYILGLTIFTSVMIGMSRIYLGVHYPSDVLGGLVVGFTWGILCWWLAEYLTFSAKKHPHKKA